MDLQPTNQLFALAADLFLQEVNNNKKQTLIFIKLFSFLLFIENYVFPQKNYFISNMIVSLHPHLSRVCVRRHHGFNPTCF
jgi:hypothetical protein